MVWSISKSYSFIFLVMSVLSMFFSVWMMQTGQSFVFEFVFFSLLSCKVEFVLYFDWMSLSFLSVVGWISSSVMLFSCSYMDHDKSKTLFFSLVLLFVISMFFMIFSLNLMSILMGWDGLGIISYLLVIYYSNECSSSGGMLTALSNRVGDVGIMLAIGFMVESGSWNFMNMSCFETWDVLLVGLIVLAGMTKSAMIPFSPWLPAAMAAPTPVSTLVHSSTLVTAGVYLIIRFEPYLDLMGVKEFLFIIGILTTLMAGLSAISEYDLKKIIALSTLSQLGVMMTILGLGEGKLAFFHLLTHASFKALLFMCSGSVIHEMKSTQDLRFLGGLSFYMPVTCTSMSLSNLALMGFPFLAGFYSKDLSIEVAMMDIPSWGVMGVLLFSIVLTCVYSSRLMFLGLINCSSMSSLSGVKDDDLLMLLSKFFLIISTITSGGVLSWFLLPSPYVIILSLEMKVVMLLVFFFGFFTGVWISVFKVFEKELLLGLGKLSMLFMWFLPTIQGDMKAKFLFLGKEVSDLDWGWFESFSGLGLAGVLKRCNVWVLSSQFVVVKVFIIFIPVWLLVF